MRAPKSLKEEILKKWIIGLKVWDSARKKMNMIERKNAIKLSADIAMASTREGKTCWSRAIVAQASKDYDNQIVIKKILASQSIEKVQIITKNKRNRSKKILKKSKCTAKRAVARRSTSALVAKRLVKNRRKVLKSLVPGGEFMDDISLIEETLDYVVSLQAQVDVMRMLAKAADLLNANRLSQ